MLLRCAAAVALCVCIACDRATPPASQPGSAPAAAKNADAWNPSQIAWRGYAEGIAEAKEQRRPICLVFFTTWCPHCANYSKVFADPRVVEAAKQFVMIRLDRDKNKEISGKFVPDGEYIPRTFFLSPAGVLEPAIQARTDQYKYFYDEQNPAALLSGMDKAREKLVPPPKPRT